MSNDKTDKNRTDGGEDSPAVGKPSQVPLSKFYREPLNALMDDYYKKLAALEKDRTQPVAWITTMVPIEILNAAGIYPFYPENYAALCAARGVASDLIHVAETKGISRDICGYATCNIGSIYSGQWAFGKGGVPMPDLLIATRLTCNLHLTWFTYLSRHLNVPLFFMDAPYRPGGAYEERDVKYFISQLKRLIEFIEEHTDRSFSIDKLQEVLELSDQATIYWSEISLSRKETPSPLGSKDVFSLMFPMVTLAGKPEAVTFYRDLSEEVNRRISSGENVPGKEKYRLIWDLFPPWHDMKLWNIFDDAGAVFVIDFYADAFSGRLNDPDPFQSIVGKYLFNPSVQRGIDDKRKKIENLAKDFHLDGAVFMSNKACRYMSIGQMDMAAYIRDRMNLRVLVFDGDHMDPNGYSRENVERQIHSFLELLSQGEG